MGGGESDEKSDRIQYDNGLVFLSTWTTYFFDEFLAADSCDVDNPPGTTGPEGFS